MAIKVGLVVTVLNQYEKAVDCIASTQTKHDIETYVVPNYRVRWPLSKTWNYGIQKAYAKGCDYVLVCNDDILFSPHTIDNMVDYFEFSENEDVVMVTGNNLRDQIQPLSIIDREWDDAPITVAESPDFSCFMIVGSMIDSAGWFDENFNPAYFEDNDYHRRIKLADKLAYNLSSAEFYHYGSQTQNSSRDGIVSSDAFVANRNYYVRKWGGEPGREAYTNPYNDESYSLRDWINNPY